MVIFKLALRNILGAGLRTWLNVFVLSLAFVSIIWMQGLIDGMNNEAILVPREPLSTNKAYQVRVEGVTDLMGNTLSPAASWQFGLVEADLGSGWVYLPLVLRIN